MKKIATLGVIALVLVMSGVYANHDPNQPLPYVGVKRTINTVMRCSGVSNSNPAIYTYQLKNPSNVVVQSGSQTAYYFGKFTITFTPNVKGTWKLVEVMKYKKTNKLCNSRTTSIPISQCGDSIVEGIEQCDGGANCDNTCHNIPPPPVDNTPVVTGNYSMFATPASFTLRQNVNDERFVLRDAEVDIGEPARVFGSEYYTILEVGSSVWNNIVYNRTSRAYYTIDLGYVTNNVNYAGDFLSSVVLNISTDGHNSNPPIGVYRFDYDWTENGINWIYQPCGQNFNCSSNSKVVPSQIKNTLVNGDHIWSIDITSLVNEALSEGKYVLHLAFRFENEGTNQHFDLSMYSKEQNDRCVQFPDVSTCRTPQTLDITF